MMVLDFVVATLVAVLSGLGVGSGGILVLYLTLIRNVPQLTAQGINLLFFVAAALSALVRYAICKKIVWRTAHPLSVFSIAGCAVGTWAAHLLPAENLTVYFAWFMILSGGYLLLKSGKSDKK